MSRAGNVEAVVEPTSLARYPPPMGARGRPVLEPSRACPQSLMCHCQIEKNTFEDLAPDRMLPR